MSAEAAFSPARPAPSSGWVDLLAEGRAPVLGLVMLGCWVVAADSLVTATIMPSVGAALDGFASFGWAASGFMTGLVVATATSSWLAERIGLRAAMMLAGAGFAIGCAMSAAAPGIGLFLAGRVLQGCAAGWVIGLIYVALAILFPARHLPRVFAMLTSIWGVATFAGPLLGGLYADAGAWRGVFWLFAAQGLVFAAASLLLIPAATARDAGTTLPLRALVLLASGIGALATASVVAALGLAIPLAAAGTGLLVGAIRSDRLRANGLVPRSAADPAFPLGSAYLTYFFMTAAGVAFALYAPAMLQHRAGLGALEAGYLVAVEALAWTVAALAVAGSGEIWRTRFIAIGAAAILVGTIAIAVAMNGTSLAAVAAAGATLGAGFGLYSAFLSQRVMGAFDDGGRVRGSSAISAARNSGGALGAAVAAIAANAAGFGAGLSHVNAAWVSWGAFGSSVLFALAGLAFAIRVVRSAQA
ncbi:MAG TPA: MFS transporter [Allosphingosinicella sp.]|jgi:MFS family permease